MIIIVFLRYLYELSLSDLLLLFFEDAALYLWSDSVSTFSLQEINLCEDLP